MKTLEEIKEECAKEYNLEKFEDLFWFYADSEDGVREMERIMDEVSTRFALEAAKEALKNAANNFTIDDIEVSEGGQLYYDVISHNIQDETNIPKL